MSLRALMAAVLFAATVGINAGVILARDVCQTLPLALGDSLK
jgi:hypothetical protein